MTAWRKSTRCSNEGNCVEAGRVVGDGAVAVRDSADPGGPVLVLGPAAWAGLLRAVKDTR